MDKRILLISAVLIVFAFSGCTLNQLAVRSTSGILSNSFDALMAEDDLQIARTAIETDLKMIEGLIRTDPENSTLLLYAAQGFSSYSLAFAEDEDKARAIKLYKRGRNYASRWLKHKYGVDLLSIDKLDKFEKVINKLSSEAVPGVFWLGNSWASLLLLSLDDIESIASLPRVEMLMKFVLDNDETYYYGGTHLFFGAYFGGRPRMLGGDPEKARFHIEKQREMTEGKFLLGDFFMVKYVALPALDEKSSRKILHHIINFDLESAPDIRLINSITQEKAKHLLDNIEDFL
ncbi:MAG: TRAP transporter TatT component family protein [Candidatus Electryonea clarkiae]|nr:TRAP transporter TatT component family protein [Candidatus Electryonea clarkiae]MDP8286918.1 TRAP transporter TatT component family protein [Candidatus Electryonea clarkiae]